MERKPSIFRQPNFSQQELPNVSTSTFTGVASGAFQKLSAAHAQGPKSRDLVQRTVTFIKDQERGLRRGQRLPFSTEIIESCFGCYKQLEGQHSKGGFTTLLPAFGALLREATAASIERDLQCAANADVRR